VAVLRGAARPAGHTARLSNGARGLGAGGAARAARTLRKSPSLSFMMLALWMAVTLRRLFRNANPNAYSTVRRDFSAVITCGAAPRRPSRPGAGTEARRGRSGTHTTYPLLRLQPVQQQALHLPAWQWRRPEGDLRSGAHQRA